MRLLSTTENVLESSGDARPWDWRVGAAVALAFALAAALSSGLWWQSPEWWAFAYLRRLAAPWLVGAAVAAALLGALSWRWHGGSPVAARSPTGRAAARGALVFALSFTLFFALRERLFWGDAEYTIRILEGRSRVEPLGIYFWKQPGDRLLAMLFHEVARHGFGKGAAWGIALMNSLAGAAAVLAVFRLARALRLDRRGERFAAASLLAMGASQLFFGHVENYTLVYLGLLVFSALALESLAGRVAVVAPVTVAAVALSLHGLAIYLFPAVVYLLWRATSRWSTKALAVFPGTAYLLVFYAFARWLGAGPLPVGVNRFADNASVLLSPAAALAPAHLAEVGQGMLRAGALGVWLLLPLLIRRRAWTELDVGGRLLWLNAVAFVGFAVFFHGTLPRERDWDLFAAAALPLTVAVVRTALPGLGESASRAFRLVTALSLALSAAATLPWILSNRFPGP